MNKNLIPDKINSTYWWIIYLNPNNPRNKKTVSELTGYSKFQMQSEAMDKIYCLCRKIEMLQKNGYLERATKIEIYKKLDALPNKTTDRLLITLKNNDYEIPAQLLFKMPYELKTFLDSFYKVLRMGEPTEKLIPLPDKKFSKDLLFDISRHTFTRLKDLHDWCNTQIANGEAREMVLNFYQKYSTKNNLV